MNNLRSTARQTPTSGRRGRITPGHGKWRLAVSSLARLLTPQPAGQAALFLAAAVALAHPQTATATVVIHTTNFLSGWTNYNGFEGMGWTITYNGQAGYSEQAITATYVGTPGTIMSTVGAAEGRYSWYPNAGSYGYTSLRFGGVIDAVSFLASTGFGGASSPVLHYQLLLGGSVLVTGQAGPLSIYGDGWRWYGVSGVQFDELRLQARSDQLTAFLPNGYDALSLDGIRFNGYWQAPPIDGPPEVPGVPEISMWAMLVAGFGLTGIGARRRPRLH